MLCLHKWLVPVWAYEIDTYKSPLLKLSTFCLLVISRWRAFSWNIDVLLIFPCSCISLNLQLFVTQMPGCKWYCRLMPEQTCAILSRQINKLGTLEIWSHFKIILSIVQTMKMKTTERNMRKDWSMGNIKKNIPWLLSSKLSWYSIILW
jgi:hypothetical protein